MRRHTYIRSLLFSCCPVG